MKNTQVGAASMEPLRSFATFAADFATNLFEEEEGDTAHEVNFRAFGHE